MYFLDLGHQPTRSLWVRFCFQCLYLINSSKDTGLNNITLKGILEPVQGSANLSKVSTLFTNYLNGDTTTVQARGRSTLQNDGSVIQWLSDGLTALDLNVPFKSFVPIDPIRSIEIGDLALFFSHETPWAPGAASNSVHASLRRSAFAQNFVMLILLQYYLSGSVFPLVRFKMISTSQEMITPLRDSLR